MTKPDDTRSGHVPDQLVYGPVQSRRFGLSLGVSFSAPGATVCRWRCPYCQLGDWPFDETAPWPGYDTIIKQCREALLTNHERPLVITVAGGGEPSDHPDFAGISTALRELADEHGVRLLLLSNGDGLDDAGRRAALAAYHEYHIKWDPGPRAGSWRPGRLTAAERIAMLKGLPGLRLQTMLYDDGRGGNFGNTERAAFRSLLVDLQPDAVHLGTIDREPRMARYKPVSREILQSFAAAITIDDLEIIVH